MTKRNIAILLAVSFMLYAIFFLFMYGGQPFIDFSSLYVAGKVFFAGEFDALYDYIVIPYDDGFLLECGDRFREVATAEGIYSRTSVPLYLYAPSYVPLFSLFTLLPYSAAGIVLLLINCAVIPVCVFIIIRSCFPPEQVIPAFVITAFILLFSMPVRWTMMTGQMTAIMFLLTLLAWKSAEQRREITGGILLSFAFWFKFFPALLILYWLRQRRLRALLSWFITVLIIASFGVAVFGVRVYGDYVRALRALGSGIPIFPVNQSLESTLLRWVYPLPLISTPLLYYMPTAIKIIAQLVKFVLVISLVFVLLSRESRPKMFQAFLLLALSAILLPVSWNHYYVFFLPLILYLVATFSKTAHERPSDYALCILIILIALFQFSISSPWKWSGGQLAKIAGASTGEWFMRLAISRQYIGGILIYLIALYLYLRGKIIQED